MHAAHAKYEEICQVLATRLGNIVSRKDGIRMLVQLQGNRAQRALDHLKALLAHPTFTIELRADIVVAMQRLAKRRNLLPQVLVGVQILDKLPLHRGGFAEVYRGVYEGKTVCVKKLIPKPKSLRESVLQLCAKEAILWGSLDHPNIHEFFGVCELNDHLCLISPWASSGTITEYLQKYPNANRLKFAADMAEGLKYLHSLRIIHGDIKSANVLIRIPDGPRAVLADFGISSLSGEGIVDLTSFSDVNSIGGTVRWQAPELLAATTTAGRIPNSRESDIWALGCTFYEIFVGKVPYFGVGPLDIKDHVVRQGKRPQRPDDRSPVWREHGLNKKIWHLFEKCWSTEPKDRPTIEHVVGFLSWRMGFTIQSAQQPPRHSSSGSEKIAAFNQLKALFALEGLLATVGSTNGELTEPATPENQYRARGQDRRKRLRSVPDSDRENRAPKRVKQSHEIGLHCHSDLGTRVSCLGSPCRLSHTHSVTPVFVMVKRPFYW